jgi:ParB family chromosome partitioning protein
LIGKPDAERLAGEIVGKGLTVRQTEALAKGRSGANPHPTEKDPNTTSLETDLGEALGMAVELRHAEDGGELRIRYATLEQLDDLCRRLMRG